VGGDRFSIVTVIFPFSMNITFSINFFEKFIEVKCFYFYILRLNVKFHDDRIITLGVIGYLQFRLDGPLK
jgi:hypothetical protein